MKEGEVEERNVRGRREKEREERNISWGDDNFVGVKEGRGEEGGGMSVVGGKRRGN